MENLTDYVKSKKARWKEISERCYTQKDSNYYHYGHEYDKSIYYSFDDKEEYDEVCFARLHSHMNNDKKEFSSNYILKLPYKNKEDKLGCVNLENLNYENIFTDVKDLVSSVYDFQVYKTGYKNIKFLSLQKKLDIDKELDYALTLVMFTLFRGMDSEYWKCWRNNDRKNIPQNLSEFIYEYGIRTRGSSGHDINDKLAELFHNHEKYQENFLKSVSKSFIETLRKTFGKDGLVNDKNYQKYFKNNIKNDRWGSPMQTSCYNYIEITTGQIIMEKNL